MPYPVLCDAALVYTIEATMTAGDVEDAPPLTRQIAETNIGITLIGTMGLFVAHTEFNQKVAERPYRSAAEMFGIVVR
jgi:hypothetical protein